MATSSESALCNPKHLLVESVVFLSYLDWFSWYYCLALLVSVCCCISISESVSVWKIIIWVEES